MFLSSISDLVQIKYGLATLQASLCHFSTALRRMASVLIIGRLLGWNFSRHTHLLGVAVSKDKQQNLMDFPIERAHLRLRILFLARGSAESRRWGLVDGRCACFWSICGFGACIWPDVEREKSGRVG